VLDASVLVDLLAGGERSHTFVEEALNEGVDLYAVRVNIVEAS
jgi:predicted nucleic acid-binding protein